MKYVVLFFLLVTLSSCVLQSRETLAEVEFENAHLGLEYIPDPSLEGYNTTLHVFYQPQGEDNRKYIYEPKDGFRFNVFPRDIKILKGIKFSVIDTVARNIGSYKPTEANTTLYVDPSLITEKSWEIFNRFVQQSYQKPDS